MTAARVIDIVKKSNLLGIEKKFLDEEGLNDVIATSWAEVEPTFMSIVPEGAGPQQRVGNDYTIDSIQMRGFIETDNFEAATAPFVDFTVRLVLVVDFQTNGAQVVINELFQTDVTDDELAYRNLDHIDKFRIIWDKTFDFKPTSATVNEGSINLYAVGNLRHDFKMFHKFKKGLVVHMEGSTQAIANVTDNRIVLLAIASNIALAPKVTTVSRLRYRG